MLAQLTRQPEINHDVLHFAAAHATRRMQPVARLALPELELPNQRISVKQRLPAREVGLGPPRQPLEPDLPATIREDCRPVLVKGQCLNAQLRLVGGRVGIGGHADGPSAHINMQHEVIR